MVVWIIGLSGAGKSILANEIFLRAKKEENKTILLDGDSIFVPRNPNTINVLGEVLNSIAFEFNKRITLNSAIDNSGGYQDYADKRKVYVIKAMANVAHPRMMFHFLKVADVIVIW